MKLLKKGINFLLYKEFFNFMPDEAYLKFIYKLYLGKKLNLDNPQTFTEKIQWLKLNDRRDIYTKMVDKYEAKKYIADKIGEQYIIPTIGVYDKFDDIDFDKLPNQFVIKCTHDSGGVVICKDKSKFDIQKAKKKINKCLRKNFYYSGREWPYKNVKPRIIIEEYMEDKETRELIDYKVYGFRGQVKCVVVCSERFSSDNMCITWFDENWKLLDIIEDNHRINKTLKKPKNFEMMKKITSELSKDKALLRVDFYEINGELKFGEMTFYPASGILKLEPQEWNYTIGKWIEI